MILRMDALIKTIGTALDIVESELVGASTNHGKRIAVLVAAAYRDGKQHAASAADGDTLCRADVFSGRELHLLRKAG